MMAVAAWLVWQKRGERSVIRPLALFAGQLMLNLLWSLVFFGMQAPGLAFGEIVTMWAAILLTVVAFGRVSRLAQYLLLPYFAWVSFAAFLNFTIWRLNVG
jgi:tryptophan-rich sensory protein